ncbi:MAG: hypothetical protein U5N85_11785 [Arcicella sp.]|nr:hypothetical protein [Arcicella sp.]
MTPKKQQLDLELDLLISIMGIYDEEYSVQQLSNQLVWNTAILEINIDGTYKSQYLYDVEKVKADELFTAKDFAAFNGKSFSQSLSVCHCKIQEKI